MTNSAMQDDEPRVLLSLDEMESGRLSAETIGRAAELLQCTGWVVISSSDPSRAVVSSSLCAECATLSSKTLDNHLELVSAATSKDPRDSAFSFAEICMRSDRSLRYDLTLSQRGRPPIEWRSLFKEVDQFAHQLLNPGSIAGLLDHGSSAEGAGPCAAMRKRKAADREAVISMYGCVISESGAPNQGLHRDGAASGAWNIFVPLVDVDCVNGATQFQPGLTTTLPPLRHARTHALCAYPLSMRLLCPSFQPEGRLSRFTGSHRSDNVRLDVDDSELFTPHVRSPIAIGSLHARAARRPWNLLECCAPTRLEMVDALMTSQVRAGELLIFDYRTVHRGLANRSQARRPIACAIYVLGNSPTAFDRGWPPMAVLSRRGARVVVKVCARARACVCACVRVRVCACACVMGGLVSGNGRRVDGRRCSVVRCCRLSGVHN